MSCLSWAAAWDSRSPVIPATAPPTAPPTRLVTPLAKSLIWPWASWPLPAAFCCWPSCFNDYSICQCVQPSEMKGLCYIPQSRRGFQPFPFRCQWFGSMTLLDGSKTKLVRIIRKMWWELTGSFLVTAPLLDAE